MCDKIYKKRLTKYTHIYSLFLNVIMTSLSENVFLVMRLHHSRMKVLLSLVCHDYCEVVLMSSYLTDIDDISTTSQ